MPFCGVPLTRNGGSAQCAECIDPYSIENDIWILDVIRRKDREAFDEQVKSSPVAVDLSKELTDKHYFRDDVFAAMAHDIGYRKVQFGNVADDTFYDVWMARLLERRVRNSARVIAAKSDSNCILTFGRMPAPPCPNWCLTSSTSCSKSEPSLRLYLRNSQFHPDRRNMNNCCPARSSIL